MAVQVVEGYYPAELINGAIFERFGFCRSFLNHPGGGYTFDFNAMVMWVDQDILLFQPVHESLLKVGALSIVLWDIQCLCLWA
jgi:hypothetical protein